MVAPYIQYDMKIITMLEKNAEAFMQNYKLDIYYVQKQYPLFYR